MSNLKVSAKVKFNDYKGFVYNVEPLDDKYNEFVGVALLPDSTIRFDATGKTRNECGRKLEEYIDMYRKSQPERLIIS